GIDVSLELSSVCIVDATGEIVKEAKVESHPDALVRFFKAFGLPLTVIEAVGDVSSIGERRQHVGAQKQQDLQPPVGQSLCDVRHLVWNVASRWTPFRRAQVPQTCALRAMTWPKSTSWKTKIASQRRQAADRMRGMPAVGTLVHGTAAKQDHGRSHGGVGPGNETIWLASRPVSSAAHAGVKGR